MARTALLFSSIQQFLLLSVIFFFFLFSKFVFVRKKISSVQSTVNITYRYLYKYEKAKNKKKVKQYSFF